MPGPGPGAGIGIVPRPVQLVTCGTCGQDSRGLFLCWGVGRLLIAGHCPECDAGHCPRCGVHTSTWGAGGFAARCPECDASLALPN